MRYRYLLRVICLLALLASFVPAANASALVATAVPPVDMFQLPWEQGLAWVAIDGLDNGTKRPLTSSHHFSVGGAIDFAPHNNMVKGENTSTFWAAAAAAGTVVGTSSCHVILDHGNGWVTQYQFLANVQVKLGDAVSRNQRLGIIADGVRQKFCPGSLEPNVPHLHFMLRPTMRNATFAGWQVNYLPVLNKTTFTKNGETLGLFKPLLNVMDSPSTPTPTPSVTAIPGSETPTASVTPSPTQVMSPTPTLFGPYVSTTVNPQTIYIDETALVTVSLNNVPAEGYTSAELSCSFDASIVEVSNIVVTDLFGADAAVAINGPQNNSFIIAIAGSNGNKASASGPVFTFGVKGLQVGETNLGCEARVSTGDNVLTQIPSARTFLTVLSITDTPTPNLTPGTPTVQPSACDRAEFIADVTVPPGTIMSPATTFTKTWRLKNLGPCTWTTSYGLVFFYGELMGAPASASLPQSVDVGETVDISVSMTAPNAPGSYRGYWIFRNSSGLNFGIGPDANQPWFVDINVSGPTLPPSPTSTPVPSSPTPTITPDVPTATQTSTPGAGPIFTATPTSPINDWLTFTNSTYGFEFKYPPQGQIQAGSNDGDTRINNLPLVQPGTNLTRKFMEVFVGQNVTECKSPLPTQDPGQMVTINGISFLKQTGQDAAVGSIFQSVVYSTLRDGVCVNLGFVLQSHDPSSFPTPPPVFDYATETALFGQMVETFTWLTQTPTATPGFETPLPFGSPTPTITSTPVVTVTGTPISEAGLIVGKVFASKLVRIEAFDVDNNLVGAAWVNTDGTFDFHAASGTNSVIASASGFLSAQLSVTVTDGSTTTLPTITLLAGDIDGNNVIDQFDAMTIGMSYNTSTPTAADLNNDGIINVLDLELLAKNYRRTGPVVWE